MERGFFNDFIKGKTIILIYSEQVSKQDVVKKRGKSQGEK